MIGGTKDRIANPPTAPVVVSRADPVTAGSASCAMVSITSDAFGWMVCVTCDTVIVAPVWGNESGASNGLPLSPKKLNVAEAAVDPVFTSVKIVVKP